MLQTSAPVLPAASTAIAVRPFAGADEAAWERFVAAAPAATIFHRLGWKRVVERSLGHACHYRCAWRDGALVGVLPLIHVRSPLFGTSLLSVGFGVYGGILAADDAVARSLAEDAAELGRSLGVDYVELRHLEECPIGWPAKSELYFTFSRTLSPANDKNLKAIPRKKRADLRKAIDNPKLAVDVGCAFEVFYRIYSESLRNLGTPVLPRRFYRAIVEEFGTDVELSAVRGPDGPVAALMTFTFRDRVMPYYGGATPAARPLHAYDLLYWSLMERAAAAGKLTYDFGRSKRGTGSFDYKTYWGFEPVPLRYQVLPLGKPELPDVNPLNPKYRLMIATWQRLPLAVANLVGPMVARQIG
ncbi:MAG TPA: FemAB family XrtA/PEP-CTERM system-associated protein [Stellaceae bacterium]|nr:FemAB family XrtA/PEP-CTERM system-associated protein [Stellaceae bacterium]